MFPGHLAIYRRLPDRSARCTVSSRYNRSAGDSAFGEMITSNKSMLFPYPFSASSMSRPLPSEICWRDSARSERICSWPIGTNGFAGLMDVNSFWVNSMTLILASSGIASSMDTVASKVLMGKPPLMIGFIEIAIVCYVINTGLKPEKDKNDGLTGSAFMLFLFLSGFALASSYYWNIRKL